MDTAKISLTQPMSNVLLKKEASAVKRVKARVRIRLKNVMLLTCLHVSINGTEPKSKECQVPLGEAAQVWRNTHKRNLPRFSLSGIGDNKHEDKRITETATGAIQIEAPGNNFK